MKFDVLIIGGGAASMSCALILGSALQNNMVSTRKVGIHIHQKASHLNSALLKCFGGCAGDFRTTNSKRRNSTFRRTIS